MSFLGFRVGFPDHSQPYEITALQRDTTVQKMTHHKIGGLWEFTTVIEIYIFCKRLSRDNVDPQLGNMEREVQRIVCTSQPGDITGVTEIIYDGQERLYTGNDSYAASEWRTLVRVLVKTQVQNPDLG